MHSPSPLHHRRRSHHGNPKQLVTLLLSGDKGTDLGFGLEGPSCRPRPLGWAGRSISTSVTAGAGSSAWVRVRLFERHEDPKSTTVTDDPIFACFPTARLVSLFGQMLGC